MDLLIRFEILLLRKRLIKVNKNQYILICKKKSIYFKYDCFSLSQLATVLNYNFLRNAAS